MNIPEHINILGPYLDKKQDRMIITLYNTRTKKNKTMTLPRFLMQHHLGRAITENEEVHHIDGNPLNNQLSNLQVMKKTSHACMQHTIRVDICGHCRQEYHARAGQKFCTIKCRSAYHWIRRAS